MFGHPTAYEQIIWQKTTTASRYLCSLVGTSPPQASHTVCVTYNFGYSNFFVQKQQTMTKKINLKKWLSCLLLNVSHKTHITASSNFNLITNASMNSKTLFLMGGIRCHKACEITSRILQIKDSNARMEECLFPTYIHLYHGDSSLYLQYS